MKRIIISVTNDLTTDQRVAKVCNTLNTNGYEVLLIGRRLKNSKPVLRPYKTYRFSLFFNKGFLFYAEYNLRLFFKLLGLKKEQLLANDLDTLAANYWVSKIQGVKLVYDSHELFPEIPELVHKPKVKQFWTFLEGWLLPKLKYKYTVCDSIANYYYKKYQSHFLVVKNLPLAKKTTLTQLPFNTDRKKIILYQGALNVGRGLELMINTMEYLDDCTLVIVGDGDIAETLKKSVEQKQLMQNVIFLGKKTPEELHTITPNADLGISLEEDLGLNYRFALPNKIFDYIQAEVPILVADLPEMKNVVLNYNVGEIIIERSPKRLAVQIQKMLTKEFHKALSTAKKELIWEHQEEQLLSIFNQK